MKLFTKLTASPLTRWVVLPALCAAGLAVVWAQTTPSLPPTVALSPEPLYAKGARAKPTLTLALSVEFPTVGAQYVGATADVDSSYSSANKYVGYFDTESCYAYNRGDENVGDVTLRYFKRIGAATSRTCNGTGFSGNFMNWATSSAVDVLRLGLTGGDRVVDTATLTVLQRAVLPGNSANNNTNFWNGTNFPSKQITKEQAADAVPSSLLPSGFTGTLYVANCLNRVHFGTQKTGSCDAPGNNGSLGIPVASPAYGPTSQTSGALPGSGWTTCAAEGGVCAFSGVKEVAYGSSSGSGNSWLVLPASNGIACSNTMTGPVSDPRPGIAKECRVRTYSGSWAPTSSTALTLDTFFYTRVRVCETDGTGTLTDPRANLCLRYPNGNYKPVGNLQKYSDSVRVAAFGYLNDNSDDPQRYGGVLRAPMKYVGSRAYDANFSLVSGTNAVREWEEDTGVFRANPDSVTAPNSGSFSNAPNQPISGVINYLNQFGRTGAFGQYKRRDPVGELYYESLRYLQGLPPTQVTSSIPMATDAMAGINNTLRDGFPVVYTDYPAYTDPHPSSSGTTDYSCFKNNIVGIGDVNANADKFLPGNTRTGFGDIARAADDSANEPDFKFWTKVVGGFESNNNGGGAAVSYTDGKGAARTTSNPNASPNTARWGMEGQSISGGATYYVAGAAYWANTHDIRGAQWTAQPTKQRPGMRVTTYWLDANEFAQQTSPAVHRSSNQFYLSAKYGGFKDVTGTGNPFKKLDASGAVVTDPDNLNWERKDSNPDLQEAKNYFLASSADTVLDALDKIFQNIASEANSIAGGAISTSRVTSTGGLVYQAQFDPADWSGDLLAYNLSLSADSSRVEISSAAASIWTAGGKPVGAAGKLDATAPSSRKIYVGYDSTTTASGFDSSDFTWSAVNTSVKNQLYTAATEAALVGENRLNYLRGDRTLEAGGTAGGTFRKRGSVLGDIINSGISYQGAPSRSISDASYAGFLTTNASRSPTLFVGANDGMLHAFDATTGAEQFAYIPSWVVPNLRLLTKSPYTHRSYVDGTPVVAEANLGSTTVAADANWRSVLVGGSGGGGQGVYALDVTNPAAFGNSNVLWEFTDRNDVDMGNVIGTPQVLKMNIAAAGDPPDYRYFAVVASGVNNHLQTTEDTRNSLTGRPALFFLRLDKPKSTAWALGTNYFKVEFPVITTDSSLPSGLANFTARADFARAVTYLYAGDLQGQLWKLDFRGKAPGSWNLSSLSFFSNGSGPMPMFVAVDAAGNRQPITMRPALTFGPNRGIIVSFGTGRYLSDADNSSPFRTQSTYAVFDNNSTTPDSSPSPSAAISGRSQLQAGVVTATSITVPSFTWGRPATPASTASRAGWYFDFLESGTSGTVTGTGERQISGFSTVAGRLIFGSVIPAVTSCDNGSGNLYDIDVLRGNGIATVSPVGILGEPFLTRVGYSTASISDSAGTRRETTRYQIILQGSGGLSTGTSTTSQVAVGKATTGRVAWREISNYQDLRNAP